MRERDRHRLGKSFDPVRQTELEQPLGRVDMAGRFEGGCKSKVLETMMDVVEQTRRRAQLRVAELR